MSGRGSIWRIFAAWRPGTIRGLKPPLPEQLFEREFSHRNSDVRFARFRRASFTLLQEIATWPREAAPEPVSWSG